MAELQECRDCTRGFISILQPLCLGPPPPVALVATPPEWPQNRLANIVLTCPSEFSHVERVMEWHAQGPGETEQLLLTGMPFLGFKQRVCWSSQGGCLVPMQQC